LAWTVEVDPRAVKELGKLDRQIAGRILRFVRERVGTLPDPRSIGEALRGSELGSFWRYRVGDCRLICSIEDDLLVLRVARRREVYSR
jgi:mRNA interferase RelE/StbE